MEVGLGAGAGEGVGDGTGSITGGVDVACVVVAVAVVVVVVVCEGTRVTVWGETVVVVGCGDAKVEVNDEVVVDVDKDVVGKSVGLECVVWVAGAELGVISVGASEGKIVIADVGAVGVCAVVGLEAA